MNLSCVICAELFSPSDDVHVTQCGHMFHNLCLIQWFERSKTCPQCRCKCIPKSVHKIYFNLGNLDTSRLDAGSLQSQLDDMVLKVQCMEKELQKSNTVIEELKNSRKKCKSVIVGLEKKVVEKTCLVQNQDTMLKVLRSEVKIIEEQRKEIENLKGQMELVDSIKTVISSRLADVEKLVKENHNVNSLATLVVALKRELLLSETKRTDLRNALASSHHDFRKERDAKKLIEEKLSGLESENYRLNNMVENLNSTTMLQRSEISNIKKTDLNQDVESGSPLSISKRVKLIQESSSPYLNIKSCSIGLSHLLQSKDKPKKIFESCSYLSKNKFETRPESTLRKCNSDLSEKYAIFKKPRLIGAAAIQSVKSINSNLAYNGYGGLERKIGSDGSFGITKPSTSNRLKDSKLK